MASTFGGCGGLVRTEFSTATLGECGGLEVTDLGYFHFEKVWYLERGDVGQFLLCKGGGVLTGLILNSFNLGKM